MPKTTKDHSHKEDLRIQELTADLQRTRADFENYRKRAEAEKEHARAAGKTYAIKKLLPVIDNIERAISHMPAALKEDKWAQGVAGLIKNLEKSLQDLELRRIEATPGIAFDPELHEAVQMDDGEGEHEVIAEELQTGYRLGDQVIRPTMVKVTRN